MTHVRSVSEVCQICMCISNNGKSVSYPYVWGISKTNWIENQLDFGKIIKISWKIRDILTLPTVVTVEIKVWISVFNKQGLFHQE